MSKIQIFAEIAPNLPFSEFNFYDLYRELTYTGSAKVTEFKHATAEDGTAVVDSVKYYVDVVINFHGTDYDKYTVNVYRDE